MKNHTSPEAYFERLKNLADVNKASIKESNNRTIGTLIDYKRAADGINYGIIKENHHYYIKKAGIKKDPDASDFAYIGGLANITNFQYKSLHEADKQRNMLMHTIGEAVSLKPDKNGSKKRLNEDRAGMEIDNAESKLGDLDAATAAEEMPVDDSGEADMSAGLEAEPAGDKEVPAPEGGEGLSPEGEEGMPPEEGGEEGLGGEGLPPEESGEESPDDAEMTMGGDKDEATKELEKSIGKITNTIRKTELTPEQVKSYVNSYLSAFKEKFPELEIEDRKEMANRILKVVPPEDVADLGDSMPPEEKEVDESGCNECGSFAKYAESRGYDSAESLMECGEEEVGNLVSGYANAHNDGQNDGDLEGVALVIKVINPEILNSLKGDYGHEEYSNKLAPYVNSMNESTDEENIEKLNELFGGLRALGQAAGRGISNAAGNVAGAVKDKYAQAKTAVGNAASNVAGAVKQGAQAVSQTYHGGEVSGEVKKLEALANSLGQQVAALNARLTKAGQEPVDVRKLIAGITNQVGAGKTANVAATTAGGGLKRESIDPANVEVQPMLKEDDEELEGSEEGFEGEETTEPNSDIQFAPAGQSLGGGVLKPDGAPTTVKVVGGNGTTVDVNLAEAKRRLIKQIAEGVNEYLNEAKPSAGLSKEKKSEVVKKAKAGEDIGKKGMSFEKVAAKAAKEYGSEEKGKKVAAAAMWKNIKKGGEEEKEVMSESEIRLRKYVRNRLEEHAGLRKPSLNESTKSETLKKLDSIIDEQLKSYKK